MAGLKATPSTLLSGTPSTALKAVRSTVRKGTLGAVFVTAIAVLTSGCINSAVLIKVKRDGSGTVEQTTLANLAAVKGMMAGLGAGSGQKPEMTSILNDAEAKRLAERMGVRLVSVTPIKEGTFEGGKAIYAFDDINKVRVDQDPQIGGGSGPGAKLASAANTPIKFAMVKSGNSSTLTISVDEKVAAEATAKAQDAPSLDSIDPALMSMVKSMFQGFRFLIDVEVDGKIVKTNADYVSGSRITLLEVDMGEVLSDESKLRALQTKIRPGVTISELRPFLKEIKGVKVNNPTLTIEYR